MQDAKPPSTRKGKGQPAKQANAGLKQRAAAAKRPKGPTSAGFVADAFSEVVGAAAQASAAARAAERGKRPLSREQMARAGDRAADQYRRKQALRSYTSASRAERSKMVAAAESRAAKGRASDRDRAIMQTHSRRVAQSAGKAAKTNAANRQHDAAVAGREAREAINGLLRQTFRVSDKEPDRRSMLAKLADSLVGTGTSDLASDGSRAALKAAGGAVMELGDLRANLQRRNGSPLEKQALRAGGPDDVLVAGARTAGNTLKAASEDPAGVTGKTLKGIVESIPEAVAAAPQMLLHPEQAAKGVAKDYSTRYGWATNPNPERREEGAKKQRERIKKEGAAPEVLDAAIVGPGASTVAARTVSRVGRVGKDGSKLRKLTEFVDEPRPDLAIGDGKAIRQRKSSGLVGVAAQRVIDKNRASRVRKQSAAKAEKQRFGTDTDTPQTKNDRQRNNQRSRQEVGRGVRGVKPGEGQVAHRSAGWVGPFDRQAAAQRKQLSKVTGTASRRVNRAADDHARPAERELAQLRPEERRAARAALEGWISVKDPAVALKQVDRAIERIARERAKLQATPKKAAEYAGLIGDQTDNLRSLKQLATDLRERPNKVLTTRLREFVETDRARRPEFEDVAADVLDRTTMKRRRVDPAAVQFGTFDQHALERKALDRIRDAGGDATKAAAKIAAKREKASTGTPAGKAKRQQLGREQRALESIAGEFGTRLSPDELATVEARLVDRHVERTTEAARAEGIDDFNPSFFGHRRIDSGGLSEFTAGAGGKGKVAGFKRSEMRLHQLGFVDETPGGFAIGKQQAAKRAAQWQLVDEVAQDFVPKWARGADGKGITRKQFESAVREHGLDPQDWALWQSKASLDDHGRGDVADGDLGLALDDVNRLGAGAPAWTRGRSHVIPRNVLEDMNQQAGRVARTAQRIAGGTSSALLGSNPFYAVRQILQTAPLTLIHMKGYGVMDPVVVRNFRALRKAEKTNPRVMRDLHDRFGTRSRMKDFTESPRMGALARDEKRWAAGLNYDQRVLFGVDFNKLVEERRSPGAKGTASVAARTAVKRNPVSVVFRASRDFNMVVDAWQDRLQRTMVLAYEDAKLSRRGVREDFPAIAAKDAGDLARKLGPVAAAAQLPWKDYKALERSPEFRHAVEDVGDQLVKFLGDYANYSKFEQRYARSIFMFYGFVRHSVRLIGTTLPLEHPFMFAAVLQLGQLSRDEKQRLLDMYAKRHVLPPDSMRGLVLLAQGDDTLKTVDTKWMNPLLGPLVDLAGNGLSGQVPIPTPYIALLEARTGVSDFTDNPLYNEKGPAMYDNELSETDRARVVANRMMSMLYPVRIANEILNGDKGKLADTSLVFDPKPVKYKADGIADERNQKRIDDAKDAGSLLRAAEAVVPLFPKRGQKLLDAAAYETDKDKPKRKKPRKPATSSGWGGGGGWGGTGGGF